jgi:hypothetical protein
MISASARSDERLLQVPERTVLIQQAFRLEWLTVAWMVVEALVAIGSGVIAGSLTLTAFGLDSVIELVSAGVLILRLTEELRRGEEFLPTPCDCSRPTASRNVRAQKCLTRRADDDLLSA